MTDKITLSNTGKTITVSIGADLYARWNLPTDDQGRAHVEIEYEASTRRVHIYPSSKGRRIGSHAGDNGLYVGMQSKMDPHWPTHGRVVFEQPEIISSGRMVLVLPDVLPAPTPRKASANKAHNTRTDYSHGPAHRAPVALPADDPRLHYPEQQELDFTSTDKPWKGIRASGWTELKPTISFPAANMLVEIEGVSMSFHAPLPVRLKILAMLQADPKVSGDVPA